VYGPGCAIDDVETKDVRKAGAYAPRSAQSRPSIEGNISFFRDSRDSYSAYIQTLDTYAAIRASVDESLCGVTRLLDIGNGGVFDYDVAVIPNVVAIDLFLDQIGDWSCPSNVKFVSGSALELPIPDQTFDGVLINMMLHHLVGKTVKESIDNVRRSISESLRVLKPGGRLVLIESCVPPWFYRLERTVFAVASRMIHLATSHPITLQYTSDAIAKYIVESGATVEVTRIPKGRWVLQYGVKVPGWITPANPIRFVVRK
jgi:SAM-dependent methyltransferase